ncbi:MAG: GNAT family N-acetyltransferase [Faecousia sp.]
MPSILETERLYLRNLRPEDAKTIFDYRNDRRCYEFQRWEDTSLEAVRAFITQFRQDTFLSGKPEQHYAICTRAGSLVGDMAYFDTERDNCITLGITVSPVYQRRGYAFEILQAVIAAIQARHPRMDIVALIDKENKSSISLFEKLGFYRECYAEGIASFVYVIDGKK